MLKLIQGYGYTLTEYSESQMENMQNIYKIYAEFAKIPSYLDCQLYIKGLISLCKGQKL